MLHLPQWGVLCEFQVHYPGSLGFLLAFLPRICLTISKRPRALDSGKECGAPNRFVTLVCPVGLYPGSFSKSSHISCLSSWKGATGNTWYQGRRLGSQVHVTLSLTNYDVTVLPRAAIGRFIRDWVTMLMTEGQAHG